MIFQIGDSLAFQNHFFTVEKPSVILPRTFQFQNQITDAKALTDGNQTIFYRFFVLGTEA